MNVEAMSVRVGEWNAWRQIRTHIGHVGVAGRSFAAIREAGRRRCEKHHKAKAHKQLFTPYVPKFSSTFILLEALRVGGIEDFFPLATFPNVYRGRIPPCSLPSLSQTTSEAEGCFPLASSLRKLRLAWATRRDVHHSDFTPDLI